MKTLQKSRANKKLDGVCGGIAEYLNIDATVVRVLYAAVTFFTGVIPGIVLYAVLAVIMPRGA